MKVYVIQYRNVTEDYCYETMVSKKIVSVCKTLERARNEVDKLYNSLRDGVSKKYHCTFPEPNPEDYFKFTRGVQYDAFDSIITEEYTIIETNYLE